MEKKEELTNATELLLKMADRDGVASLRVDDGQIFIFKKDLLEKLLDNLKNSTSDKITLFVKSGPAVADVTDLKRENLN